MKVQIFANRSNIVLTDQINEWLDRAKPTIIDKQVSVGGAGRSGAYDICCYVVIWYK